MIQQQVESAQQAAATTTNRPREVQADSSEASGPRGPVRASHLVAPAGARPASSEDGEKAEEGPQPQVPPMMPSGKRTDQASFLLKHRRTVPATSVTPTPQR